MRQVVSTRLGSIGAAGDADFFVFPVATANQSYTIFTSIVGSTTDTFITLYSTDGATVLATNDDCGSPFSCLTFSPTAAGNYYVEVKHFNANGTGDYKLSTSTTGAAAVVADDYASTWNGTSPSPGTLLTVKTGNIEVAGDVDFFNFTATSTATFTFTTSSLGAGVDTVVTVYAPSGGVVLAENDDCSTATLASCASAALTNALVYSVRVKHYSTGFGTGTYVITKTP